MPDRTDVGPHNMVPTSEEELTEKQRAEVTRAIEAYRLACLGAFSVSRNGAILKKFDLPSIRAPTEEERDARIAELVSQSVAQSMIQQAPVMANQIHNQVVDAWQKGQLAHKGPVYMNSTSTGASKHINMGTDAQPAPNVSAVSEVPILTPITSSASAFMAPTFSTAPLATTVTGGPSFPVGWDPSTGYGMPPNFSASTSQNSGGFQQPPSASQPMGFQQSPSASQPMGIQQPPSASGSMVPQGAASPLYTTPGFTSTGAPIPAAATSIQGSWYLQPGVSVTSFSTAEGMLWVVHDEVNGSVRHILQPQPQPQPPPQPQSPRPSATN